MWGMHGPFAVRIVDTLGAEDPWHSDCPMSTGTHEGLCSYPGIERRNCRDKKGIAWHGLIKPYRITERSIYLATDLPTSINILGTPITKLRARAYEVPSSFLDSWSIKCEVI